MIDITVMEVSQKTKAEIVNCYRISIIFLEIWVYGNYWVYLSISYYLIELILNFWVHRSYQIKF